MGIWKRIVRLVRSQRNVRSPDEDFRELMVNLQKQSAEVAMHLARAEARRDIASAELARLAAVVEALEKGSSGSGAALDAARRLAEDGGAALERAVANCDRIAAEAAEVRRLLHMFRDEGSAAQSRLAAAVASRSILEAASGVGEKSGNVLSELKEAALRTQADQAALNDLAPLDYRTRGKR